MPFSIFMALKGLRPKRTFLSVVTVISVLGVALGVAVLVIVLSVMNGFDAMWREKILSFNAHVTVAAAGRLSMEGDDEFIHALTTVPGVRAAAPFVQGLVFVQHDRQVYTPMVRGVDPLLEKHVWDVARHMVAGTFSVEGDRCVLGSDLAARLGLRLGDRITVYSPSTFISENEIRMPEDLVVAGIFNVGMWEFDMGYLLTSLDTARDVVGLEEGVTAVQVMTDDPMRAEVTARRLRDRLGPDFMVSSWMAMNHQLFAALKVEKNMMFFLLIFITLVAAFGIMNTLITETVKRTREIGLLKALGFSPAQIMRVFLWQGWVQGVIGIVSGMGLGGLVLRFRNELMRFLSDELNADLLPKELYHLSELPSIILGSDLLIVSFSVMIICTLAGVIPAWQAARLDPVKALRYE